jgi:tetratricopeptide (TPR) repeat protein
MTDGPQQMAERLVLQARRSDARGEHRIAIGQQSEAIEFLRQELAALDQDSPALADERRESAHRLSDCWGRLGGIYRRAGLIPEAIDAYRHGMLLERQYRLDDSYNLTNWIVVQLLEDPARLPALAGEIREAIALIQNQVGGPRRSQWWAWADLGLLCLLAGRFPEARAAYERFPRTGAKRAAYQSVLAVLGPLEERFRPSAPDLAAGLKDAIVYLESASTGS